MDNVMTIVRELSPALRDRTPESLERTCRAYRGGLDRYGSFDAMERDYMKSGMGAFSEDIKRRFGTVWTDQRVVDLTVDEALKFYRDDLDTATFCDPSCGDGNFLVTFYRRLVERETLTEKFADPVERSLSVLGRIYGVDIIDRMAGAARMRLVLEHVNYLKSLGLARTGAVSGSLARAAEAVGRNIIHGNTLRTEGDSWALMEHEGGMCPDWFRTMKFDVICGNPPYTSYGIGSRNKIVKPVAYADTKTMAESFVKWANNHLSDIGVAGLNLGEMVLNGASQIRSVIAKQITSVIYNDLTKGYSAAAGGFLPTVVFTFVKGLHNGLIVNGQPSSLDINIARFLRLIDYKRPTYRVVPIFQYSRIGHRVLSGSGSKDATMDWKEMVVATRGRANQDFYIGLPYHVYISRARGVVNHQCKWFECDESELRRLIAEYRVGSSGGGGDVKFFAPIDREAGLVLWSFLNSTLHLDVELRQWGKAKRDEASGSAGAAFQLNASDMELCRVPDLDYYKRTRPAEYQAVLDFAEAHIKSGDVKSYCTGVNTVINDLLGISDTPTAQPKPL